MHFNFSCLKKSFITFIQICINQVLFWVQIFSTALGQPELACCVIRRLFSDYTTYSITAGNTIQREVKNFGQRKDPQQRRMRQGRTLKGEAPRSKRDAVVFNLTSPHTKAYQL